MFGGNRLAIAGLTLLAAAMTGAITLVTDFLYQLENHDRRRPPSSRFCSSCSGTRSRCAGSHRTASGLARRPQRARQLERALAVEGALEADEQVPALQQQHVVREAELAFGELRVRRAVEEEVRRALDPDRAIPVDAQPLDASGLARDLPVVLGSKVASELADEQPESACCPSRASPRPAGR